MESAHKTPKSNNNMSHACESNEMPSSLKDRFDQVEDDFDFFIPMVEKKDKNHLSNSVSGWGAVSPETPGTRKQSCISLFNSLVNLDFTINHKLNLSQTYSAREPAAQQNGGFSMFNFVNPILSISQKQIWTPKNNQ